MERNDWLNQAVELFARLADGHDFKSAWHDFLMWSALETAYYSSENQRLQEKICSKYSLQQQKIFFVLFRTIAIAVGKQPRQNVPLRVMRALGLTDKYYYNEASALKLLKSQSTGSGDNSYRMTYRESFDDYFPYITTSTIEVNRTGQQSVFPSCDGIDNCLTIDGIGNLVVIDDRCSFTGGSRLIATANVFFDHVARDCHNHLMMAALDSHDKDYALMSFLQLSLMNVACYVLVDDIYAISTIGNMEVFAPPTALCSVSYFDRRWKVLREKILLAAKYPDSGEF